MMTEELPRKRVEIKEKLTDQIERRGDKKSIV